jgi:hypothetical protein
VTQAIESVAEVRTSRVSFDEKRAEVESNSCEQGVLEQISAALHAEGYGGTVIAIDDLSEL